MGECWVPGYIPTPWDGSPCPWAKNLRMFEGQSE